MYSSKFYSISAENYEKKMFDAIDFQFLMYPCFSFCHIFAIYIFP